MWWHVFHHSAANFRESGDCKDKAVVKFRLNIDGFSTCSCDKCGYLSDEDKCNFLGSLFDLEQKLPSNIIMTLIYIAGYAGGNDDEIYDTYFYLEIWHTRISGLWTAALGSGC